MRRRANLSEETRLIYLNAARDFAAFFERSPAELGAYDVRTWVGRLTQVCEAGRRD